eukprot:2566869-Prymnesium_polylepis.1
MNTITRSSSMFSFGPYDPPRLNECGLAAACHTQVVEQIAKVGRICEAADDRTYAQAGWQAKLLSRPVWHVWAAQQSAPIAPAEHLFLVRTSSSVTTSAPASASRTASPSPSTCTWNDRWRRRCRASSWPPSSHTARPRSMSVTHASGKPASLKRSA